MHVLAKRNALVIFNLLFEKKSQFSIVLIILVNNLRVQFPFYSIHVTNGGAQSEH